MNGVESLWSYIRSVWDLKFPVYFIIDGIGWLEYGGKEIYI